ncbi:MAG TPA: diguanylate cyclase [Solirubrobacteraceae bacterium]|jgi:diguanylate cyclase (GGDEF)-like protein
MASALPIHTDPAESRETAPVSDALAAARRTYLEDPAGALAQAIHCHEMAYAVGDVGLCARARALQGAVSLHRGDLRGALDLAVEAGRLSERTGDGAAHTELAALEAQLGFFTGSYTEALRHAERAIRLADSVGDLELRVFARRATCMVFGNVAVADLTARIRELLELTIEAGNRWEEAISRNDLACNLQERGLLEEAEREIARGLEVAHGIESGNNFVLGVLHSTRADIRLLAGRPEAALQDAERSIALLTASGEPNPYVLGVTVRAEVQARMALGQFEDAQQTGEGALAWLGDRVPQTRSLILSTLAEALREAGRVEEAYDALARSAELERRAFRELSELQFSLDRATLETSAARRQSETLAARNRQLAQAHRELERRTSQLEGLEEQLRDQAERDWLTGLYNRRYLARELSRLAQERLALPLSLAVLDLDRFKSINDRFGHDVGDRVLVRVAALLGEVLRGSDMVVRSGGEEFIVLMPLTGEAPASACSERIRRAIHDEPWDQIAAGLSVTTSIGVVTTDDPADLGALVKLGDQRLYDAKHAGRDRVVGEPIR